MFLHLSVILSTVGVSASAYAGIHTPQADTPPQTPPWADTTLADPLDRPPWTDTPWTDTPKQTPSSPDTPPGQTILETFHGCYKHQQISISFLSINSTFLTDLAI